jgi:3-methyladenine DNA glycosylase Mpg
LHINRAQNGADLCDAGSDLWIARNPELQALLAARGPILTSTRIGLTKAADLHLRFFLKNSPWLSKKAAARVVSEGETAKQGIGARRVGG